MKLTEEIAGKVTQEFKESATEIDYETSWAILNGLVISYLKSKGECFKVRKDALNDAVKGVILSLPKYAYGFGHKYKLSDTYKEYLALCPEELVDGMTYKDINDANVMKIAAKVIEFSAEKGADESGKTTMPPDGAFCKKCMEEFDETALAAERLHDMILATGGEEALHRSIEQYRKLAETAVDAEVKFHADNANYIAQFYSSILFHMKEDDAQAAS